MVKFSDGGEGFRGHAPNPTKIQIQVRKLDAEAAKNTAERKKTTRQKVILGGGLLRLAAAGDREALSLMDRIKADMPERDQKAFKA